MRVEAIPGGWYLHPMRPTLALLGESAVATRQQQAVRAFRLRVRHKPKS